MIVMMLGMILFWALVVVGIVWLARSASWGPAQYRHATPLNVLDQRFAAGEITVEEYRERRSVLQGKDDQSVGG